MPDQPNGQYVTGAEFSRWASHLDATIDGGFKAVNTRLDSIDDRTRCSEMKIAVLDSKVDVLEDGERSLQSEHAGIMELERSSIRKRQVAIGGGLFAGGAAFLEAVRALLSWLHP